jgi:hypothetical protein
MPVNQLFTDWVASDVLTAAKLNQMKNDLAALAGADFTGTLQVNGETVWHAGNDGAGSGLDADTVDGFQAASLQRPLLTITGVAANYEVTSLDHGSVLRVTGDATISLPGSLATGTWVRVVNQASALDIVDLAGVSGASLVTMNDATQVSLRGSVLCIKVSASVWEAYGDFVEVVSS